VCRGKYGKSIRYGLTAAKNYWRIEINVKKIRKSFRRKRLINIEKLKIILKCIDNK